MPSRRNSPDEEGAIATYVLIAGAYHGGWCFEKVVPLLAARGHHVLAPDLPGMGTDPTPLGDLSFEIWARFVADLVLAQPEPVILVGHSRGGSVISQAGEYAADNVARLVYLAALLMPPGLSMAEMIASGIATPSPALVDAVRVPTADGHGLTLAPGQAAAIFYDRCTPEDAARAEARLCAEPVAARAAGLTLTAERYGRLPRAYIECLADNAVPLSSQRAMQARMPCDPVLSIDSDHSPFYSAPEELARMLDLLGST